MSNETKELKKDYDEKRQKYENKLKEEVKKALMKKRFHASDKPLYSYADIAKMFDISTSTVYNIAKEFGLNRK